MEKDMNKTAENRRNAAESVLNGGIEYSAFENMDRLAAIFAMQKLLNDDIAARRGLEFSVEEWEQKLVLAMISELSEDSVERMCARAAKKGVDARCLPQL